MFKPKIKGLESPYVPLFLAHLIELVCSPGILSIMHRIMGNWHRRRCLPILAIADRGYAGVPGMVSRQTEMIGESRAKLGTFGIWRTVTENRVH